MSRQRVLRLGVLALLVAWPWAPLPTSLLGDANTACLYFLGAVSVVLLTGWVGQISLAQASFVGVGAYVTAMVTRGWELVFPLNIAVGALLAAVAAALLGLVALRVRGLYLAVATLIFGWVTDSYLFSASWMGGTGGSTSADMRQVGEPGTFPFIDFGNRRTFYYLALAASAFIAFALINLRDSKIGRSFFAVRGSEIAAAAFGVDVVRTKLVAFAISGAVAGVAGSLALVHTGSVVSDQFNLTQSLFYLSVAVVGGLGSLGGAVAASILFAGLNEVFFRVEAFSGYLDVVSALLLAGVLLVYPGGFAALGQTLSATASRRLGPVWAKYEPQLAQALAPAGKGIRDGLARLGVVRRRPAVLHADETGADAAVSGTPDVELLTVEANELEIVTPARPRRARRRRRTGRPEGMALEARNVTVQFGGLTAVDDVSIEIRKGEIVGLIGPNGAGKTTTFNAISGLNRPTSGEVFIGGKDVTSLKVHERAAAGLARTFQVIQLFPQMDVFDNVLVGTHVQSSHGVLSRIVLTRGAIEAELEAVERAEHIIDMLNLTHVKHHSVGGLPFGVLRMVELAQALATGAPVVMLDEPASGLDNAETDRLSAILRRVRDELGISLLVIEHDVRMVTALTDYMYVIDRGKPIADGTPEEIQRNEAVIAAYLGTAADAASEPVGADV